MVVVKVIIGMSECDGTSHEFLLDDREIAGARSCKSTQLPGGLHGDARLHAAKITNRHGAFHFVRSKHIVH